MKKIGKKIYDNKMKRWIWVYTAEERKLLKKQMMDKPHTVLTVVSEEVKGKTTYYTLSNGVVVKESKVGKELDARAIHYSGIPFNPNRGYNKNGTHNWGNGYEN